MKLTHLFPRRRKSGSELTVKSKESQKHKLYYAPQWKLIWWRFKRHPLVPIAALGLGLMYLAAIFCEFLSPYGPHTQFQPLTDAPPTKIHFTRMDENNRTHLTWPFVYGYKTEFDPATIRRQKVPDETKIYPLRFFVHSEEYALWGLIKMDLHLFGTENGKGNVFLFGSDDIARDLFSRTLYGSRISLTIGLLGIALVMVLGLIIGGFAGYYGGWIDELTMRLIDFLISIPTLPLWMALSAALPRDWPTIKTYFAITMIFSIIGWTGLARTVRGWLLALREEDFTVAARVSGVNEWRIITRHLLPLFTSYIIVSAALSIPSMILGETSLSFIGLGLQPPAVSWGVILKDAQSVVTIAHTPWKLIPGAFVVYVVLLFNFLGNGLRDASDPYHI